MSTSYEFAKRMEQLHVDDIQLDKQGNIIYNEFEQKQRNSDHWQDLEKRYSINFGDVVKLDNNNHLGRVQELSVSDVKYRDGVILDGVTVRLYGGLETKQIRFAEYGMTVKEILKGIKTQPKEKKLSITEKIKNTIKTKVQTFKKGGAAQRLANKRANEKAANTQTKLSASQSASQRLKNKRALHNTQGLER